MTAPDQPHLSPEASNKAKTSAQPPQVGIDTLEDHKAAISVLRDPQFGLTELLKDKQTLSPQQVTTIWSGENLKLLQGFPTQGTPEEKQSYLEQNATLNRLIEQTRTILTQRAAKAEESEEDEDPDAILDQDIKTVDNGGDKTKFAKEGAEARKARLSDFVKGNFPECPPEHMGAATATCVSYEDENRELFEEPNFQVSAEDVPDLKPEIDKLIIAENNDEKIAAATTKVESNEAVTSGNDTRIETKRAKVKIESDKTPRLENAAEREEATEAQMEKEEGEILKKYPELKAKLGSIGAVEALLGMVKTPKMRGRLNRVLGVIGALQNAIPGKREATTRLLNQSNLNLGASSITQVFASFASSVDTSDAYSDEEKKQIHGVLGTQA